MSSPLLPEEQSCRKQYRQSVHWSCLHKADCSVCSCLLLHTRLPLHKCTLIIRLLCPATVPTAAGVSLLPLLPHLPASQTSPVTISLPTDRWLQSALLRPGFCFILLVIQENVVPKSSLIHLLIHCPHFTLSQQAANSAL